ncbi:uncharacterized protein METZ01_LOCUS474750, partial [marine metagenome]
HSDCNGVLDLSLEKAACRGVYGKMLESGAHFLDLKVNILIELVNWGYK